MYLFFAYVYSKNIWEETVEIAGWGTEVGKSLFTVHLYILIDFWTTRM